MDRLSGIVRAYDWGDTSAIAELLGYEPSGRPEAEYWLGAHPSAPSVLESSGQTLDRVITDDPVRYLGSESADRFGRLPFLVKILAARQALSIQAHPSAAQAAAGFAREDEQGPARDAAERTYRDASHKPELICALTTFEARCGFRAPAETAEVLEAFGPALDGVRDRLAASSPAETALWLLGLPSAEAGVLARAAVQAATDRVQRRRSDAHRVELASTIEVGRCFPDDVGVVVALLLNHVRLEPGQALFLGAGNVHAYLKGVGVEVMANSDNVIRGGLTGKHIDVEELSAVVDRGWGTVPVQVPTSGVHRFEVPVVDFSLTRIDTGYGPIDLIESTPSGPEIVLVTSGSVTIERGTESLDLGPGQAAFLSPVDGPCRLRPDAATSTLAWHVTVGQAT